MSERRGTGNRFAFEIDQGSFRRGDVLRRYWVERASPAEIEICRVAASTVQQHAEHDQRQQVTIWQRVMAPLHADEHDRHGDGVSAPSCWRVKTGAGLIRIRTGR